MAVEKEKTVEELLAENAKLVADNKKKDEQIKAQKSAVKEANSLTKKITGTFESESGRKVKFKDGFVSFNLKGVVYDSQEVIENEDGKFTEVLEDLVERDFGGFEDAK